MTSTPRGYRSPVGMTRDQAARLRGERARGTGKGSHSGSGYPGLPAPPPVAWTPDRDARGAAPDRGPRCTEPGCEVRYPSGPSRPCPEHAGGERRNGDGGARRTAVRAALARIARTDMRRAVVAALQRDPRRPDREIGGEAGVCRELAGRVRRELEAAGLIAVYRAPPVSDAWPGYHRDWHGRWAVAPGTLAVVPAFPAPSPAAEVTVRAGLASATAAVPSPAAGLACACGCGETFIPWPRPDRRFATDACRHRQARRDERARLRELTAAAAIVPAPRPAPVPAATGSRATVTTARCFTTVS